MRCDRHRGLSLTDSTDNSPTSPRRRFLDCRGIGFYPGETCIWSWAGYKADTRQIHCIWPNTSKKGRLYIHCIWSWAGYNRIWLYLAVYTMYLPCRPAPRRPQAVRTPCIHFGYNVSILDTHSTSSRRSRPGFSIGAALVISMYLQTQEESGAGSSAAVETHDANVEMATPQRAAPTARAGDATLIMNREILMSNEY